MKGKIITVDEINSKFTGTYNDILVPEEYNGEDIKAKCDIEHNIAHLYTIYKSMGKWFFADYVETIFKLGEMCDEEIDDYTYDELEYCYYLGGHNLQKAKKIFFARH